MDKDLSLSSNKIDVLYTTSRNELKILEHSFVRVGVWNRVIPSFMKDYFQSNPFRELENQEWIVKAKDLTEVRDNLDIFPEGSCEHSKEGRELFLDDVTRLCYVFCQFSYAHYYTVKVIFSRSQETHFKSVENGKLQLHCSYGNPGVRICEKKAKRKSFAVEDYSISLIKQKDRQFREYLYSLPVLHSSGCDIIIEEYEMNH